jgi:hypothetical protein
MIRKWFELCKNCSSTVAMTEPSLFIPSFNRFGAFPVTSIRRSLCSRHSPAMSLYFSYVISWTRVHPKSLLFSGIIPHFDLQFLRILFKLKYSSEID